MTAAATPISLHQHDLPTRLNFTIIYITKTRLSNYYKPAFNDQSLNPAYKYQRVASRSHEYCTKTKKNLRRDTNP